MQVYDADNNYLQDISVDWSSSGNLEDISNNGTSYIYSPLNAYYWSKVGSLVGDATGTITVNGGNQSYLKIRDASGGAGVEVGDITMTTDESLTYMRQYMMRIIIIFKMFRWIGQTQAI